MHFLFCLLVYTKFPSQVWDTSEAHSKEVKGVRGKGDCEQSEKSCLFVSDGHHHLKESRHHAPELWFFLPTFSLSCPFFLYSSSLLVFVFVQWLTGKRKRKWENKSKSRWLLIFSCWAQFVCFVLACWLVMSSSAQRDSNNEVFLWWCSISVSQSCADDLLCS